jgi:hypothetical protein
MPRGNTQWEAITQTKHISSGEPDDAKVSSPVRRGVCGKVPVKVTRHFPTLLLVMAEFTQGFPFRTDEIRKSGFFDLLRHDGGQSSLTNGS